MANQFNWDKPNITASELKAVLHQQYGPECPTRILMEDDSKPIPFKSALVKCECMRCGKQFSMSPYALTNSIYLSGFVCNSCGSLSDSEVKAQLEENMRVSTLKTLKEHGEDVVQEAIDSMLEEKTGKKTKKNPQDDEFSSTADEAEMDMSEIMSEAMDDQAAMESTESTTPAEEPVEEETNSEPEEVAEEDDVSKYMASDDDYSESIENAVTEEPEVTIDEAAEPEVDEVQDEQSDTIEASSIKSEEELDAFDNEPEEEPEDEESDDDYIDMANNQTETTEESDDDGVFAVEEAIADDLPVDKSEVLEESDIPEEPAEEAEPENADAGFIWIGDKPYTQDEISDDYDKASQKILEKMHFIPFDLNTCEIESETHKINIKCNVCHNKAEFNSFDEFAEVLPLSEALSRYGAKTSKDKINNYRNIEPLVTSCQHCLTSIVAHGYNEYHKKEVLDIAKLANFEILDADKHMFINDANEEYKVKCNGITKFFKWGQLLKLLKDKNDQIVDARKLPVFAVTQKPVEPKKTTESVKPATEQIKRVVENIKIDTVSAKQLSDEMKSTFSFNKPETKVESKPVEPQQPKPIVLHAKSTEEYEQEAQQEQKPTKSVFSFGNATKASSSASQFTSDRANDSFSDLESERLKEERDLNKKNVFSIDQKFKIARKDVARLNGKINPFERKETLRQEFEETVFYDFIQQLSETTGVDYKLVLNDHTYEIPVIDFESGLRIICSNLAEADLVNVRYEWINPRVPFSFFDQMAENDGTGVLKKKRKKYKWCVLFSDSVEYAKDATFAALIKFINPKILAYEGKKIVLQDNLIFQYTKHNQYLRDFDKRNSTFPSRKPNTGAIGIIARWNNSNEATAKDVLKFKLQMESVNGNVANLDTLANDYNEYMVASIKYIEQLNKETNRVLYTITEYVEAGSCIISDGFGQCLRALLKEYQIKYPQFVGVDPFVVVELDPNTFPSPSLYEYINRGVLCKVDNAFKCIMTGKMQPDQGVDRNYRFTYVRRPEYRRNVDIDNMRQDRRMFTTGSLISRMSEEIKQAGLSNTIRNAEVKKAFIANMGYVEATQAETKLFFVNRSMIASLMTDGYTMALQEHIDESNFNASKMVNNSTVGIGVNNVMMNPNLMMKYNRIMQSGSAEAKDFFNRMVQEDYQQKMMEYMMNQQGNGQASAQFGQQPMMNPMMMGGMPNMMGMNPMMGNMGMPMPGMGF